MASSCHPAKLQLPVLPSQNQLLIRGTSISRKGHEHLSSNLTVHSSIPSCKTKSATISSSSYALSENKADRSQCQVFCADTQYFRTSFT